MKRVLVILLTTLLFIVGCSDNADDKENNVYENEVMNNNEVESVEEDEVETLFEKEMNITIGDDDNLKIDLLQVGHGRADSTDYVALKVEIENKQNKTFEFYITDLKVDGKGIDNNHSWIGEGEIAPNETIEVFINGYEYEELSIEEHVSGKIVYSDYDNNRYEIKFSEYINE